MKKKLHKNVVGGAFYCGFHWMALHLILEIKNIQTADLTMTISFFICTFSPPVLPP